MGSPAVSCERCTLRCEENWRGEIDLNPIGRILEKGNAERIQAVPSVRASIPLLMVLIHRPLGSQSPSQAILDYVAKRNIDPACESVRASLFPPFQ